MNLQDLGYHTEFEASRIEKGFNDFAIGRVFAEHKERYIVRTPEQELDAEIIGNLRFTAHSRADFPAVGDWVAISPFDEDRALIHGILSRQSIIERQAVNKSGEKQIIATNVDFALIVQAVDRDYSINRIERYLTICHKGKVEPIIILNKIDLIDENSLKDIIDQIKSRISGIPILAISNASLSGIEDLRQLIKKGKTYCMLGSSGVGKSTLLNTLLEQTHMKTNDISEHSNRGKHVTTHRELIILENGGLLIDNPGMREVGIADAAEGLEITFDQISQLARDCKFKDCTHTSETGCAVLEALERNDIDEASYDNYLRMVREKDHYESTEAEKRRKDKSLGKLIKNFQKNNYKNY